MSSRVFEEDVQIKFIHLFLQGLLGNIAQQVMERCFGMRLCISLIIQISFLPKMAYWRGSPVHLHRCIYRSMMGCVMYSLFSCSQKVYVCSTFTDDVYFEITLGKLCYEYQSITKLMRH